MLFLNRAKSSMAEANRTACLSNVHQLAQAIQMYDLDYSAYPLGPHWHELVTAGTFSVSILACPQRPDELGYGYGMNWFMRGLSDSRVPRPADTLLVADARDSTAEVWWVNDPRFVRLQRNRVPWDCHNGKASFAFCDGHVKSINHLDVTEPQWRPDLAAGDW